MTKRNRFENLFDFYRPFGLLRNKYNNFLSFLHPEYSHYYNEIYSKYISNNHDLNWNNLNNHIMCDICFKNVLLRIKDIHVENVI